MTHSSKKDVALIFKFKILSKTYTWLINPKLKFSYLFVKIHENYGFIIFMRNKCNQIPKNVKTKKKIKNNKFGLCPIFQQCQSVKKNEVII